MKKLLTGNEAIARGAFEAGVTVAAAYPGTPSTEILENIAGYPEIYAEWSPNEKVALEVGIGASIAGARVLVAMKHVGVNVAADPLLTLAYTGVNGGLVLVSADDPGMHSSQNEQDNRYYAKFAQIPLLEPSDSQEAKEMLIEAYRLSEQFDTPVLFRTTTRVAHSQSLVELGEREEVPLKEYVKNAQKYVMLPAHGRMRHPIVEERREKLALYNETSAFNRIERGSSKIGIITSGIAYQYVKEAVPEASVLKLGMTYPLPKKLISSFVDSVETCYVVEELEPFLEEQLKAWGLKVIGKELFPRVGELSSELVAAKLSLGQSQHEVAASSAAPIPVRPPVLCPGCPHRGVYYVINKLRLKVAGDIGCYTLGATPPLSSMDTCICMGASISGALGMEKARGKEFARGLVAVIGDSTFMHSGMTGLVDVVYNGGTTTTLILDNSTTAMTGHQDHPATGMTLGKKQFKQIDLEQLVRALGVERVQVVDPYDLKAVEEALKTEVAIEEPSVIIFKRPCVLLKGHAPEGCVTVEQEKCKACGMCRKLGCPALVFKGDKPAVNATLCNGCGLCIQVCRFGAIREVE
ncbi:indolepyruvate ferredoxin oxidoreductase subunit alpha [Zhaonella formicivorans]|uniref:indolepyruvate ferredoxin oxidoreductase subunit alpha n=1 Tax=Zhaonella formicivorans TaxID=2528593 RepID=UPI0010F21F71|nr:indolepyruvate ferredoxin oxidoreductase subunit alpha [Zhaonella formicivorans]